MIPVDATLVAALANATLGAFMTVQAWVDPRRRRSFAAFAAVCWYRAALDVLQGRMDDRADYEVLRAFWMVAYAGSVWLLLGWRRAAGCVSAGLALLATGVALGPSKAQTAAILVPIGYAISAVPLLLAYRRDNRFAPGLLFACSAALALMCGLFWKVVPPALDNGWASALYGYYHYTLIVVMMTLLGWLHLPRVLRGQAPVRVAPRQLLMLVVAVLVSEGLVQASLIGGDVAPPGGGTTWRLVLYGGATVAQVACLLVLYFVNSNRLLIHTENVAALLEERTASLREAQASLARQNERQAEQLDDQTRELRDKAEVIERQRRLELAAQTTGAAAHDIHNLIAPILQHVDTLEGSAGTGAPEAAQAIRDQVDQLQELNRQMLALSRRGRMQAAPLRLDELPAALAQQFPGQPLTLDGEGELWVEGSWPQLLRAAANLVRNGLDASAGRSVTLRWGAVELAETRRCHLGFLAPGAYAFLSVSDSGGGIAPAQAEHIFEPFYSSKRGDDGSGSGLGLTIVSAVVGDHRGVLDLESGPEGTTFTLYLPRTAAPADAEDPGGDETVLLVDDDPQVLTEYGQMLAAAGYHVVTAADGAEALRLLTVEDAQLLVLDMNMPERDGFETLHGAVHIRPSVRAIVHSSQVSDADALRLREYGAHALLRKPASRRDVLKAVRSALDEPAA